MLDTPYDQRGDSLDSQLYYAGDQLMRSQKYAEAAVLLEASVKLCVHYKTLELLGECLWRIERHAEAIIALSAATTLNRQHRAPALLAQLFLETGDRKRAREMAQLALHRQPEYRTMRDFLRSLDSLEDEAARNAGDEGDLDTANSDHL